MLGQWERNGSGRPCGHACFAPHQLEGSALSSLLARLIISKPPEPHGIALLQGTDGPWVGNMASVLCGSPHIYVAAPGEQDWCVTGAARCRGLGQAEAQR